jgi:hypothetical protein
VDGAARLAEARAELKPLADAVCGWIFRCCNTDERALQVGAATTTNCADLVLQNEALGQLGGYGQVLGVDPSAQNVLAQLDQLGESAGRTAVSSAAMSACAQSIAQASCTPPPANHCTPSPPPPSGDPCDPLKVFVGQQQLGQPCDSSGYECAPGLTCTNLGYDVEGVCVQQPAAGDLCLTDGACAPSFVCDWSSSTCVEGAGYGAPCSFADPSNPTPGTERTRCQVGLVCDTVTFLCTDSGCAAGSQCTIAAQCPVGTSCVDGSCGVPAQVGQSCSDDSECLGDFCLNGTCASGVCSGSMCFQGPGIGATCMVDADCQPAAGLTCSAGQCALTTVTSPSCTAANQICAQGLYCELATGATNGSCVPKLPAGSPCDSYSDGYSECWEGCLVVSGLQLCVGSAPGDAMCHG